jgi:hypothetical protein
MVERRSSYQGNIRLAFRLKTLSRGSLGVVDHSQCRRVGLVPEYNAQHKHRGISSHRRWACCDLGVTLFALALRYRDEATVCPIREVTIDIGGSLFDVLRAAPFLPQVVVIYREGTTYGDHAS